MMRFGLGLLGYLIIVAGDVVLASLQTAWIIGTWRQDRIASAYITVPIDLPNPQAITLLAATITLTPGTLTADISDGHLTVHCLHAPDPDAIRDQIKSRYERRLQRIFR